MELLKQKILKDARVIGEDILKVDNFLNHQLDIELLNELGKEFYQIFKDEAVTKILTIEASGIAISAIAAQYFKVPVVFAKKVASRNLDAETYESDVFSFTKQTTYRIRVSKKYIQKEDRVLILDDFLAKGKALQGLAHIIEEAGATLVGSGIVIEKAFQDGGKVLREQGMRVESLAKVKKMENGIVIFE
jgi:xanthine phosphoribosyltransferase